jgi:hypothetical protein
MAPTFRLLSPHEAAALAEPMRDLYAEIYAEPPYCEGPEYVARFAEHYVEELDLPGFSLASATDGDLLVGACYGWTMAAGRWFRSPTVEPPAEILNAEKFAIMEWMVRRPYRQLGIGRRLLDLVLAGRPEPYAILASNPDAPARRIYEKHLGWQFCGSTEGGFMPPMDVLALRLRYAMPS